MRPLATFLSSLTAIILVAALSACSSRPDSATADSELARPKTATGQNQASYDAEIDHRPNEPTDFRLDQRALSLYLDGVFQEQEQRYDSAALYYRQAWRFFPESKEIGFSLASMLYRLREPAMALDILDMITTRDADLDRLAAACYYELHMEDSVRAAYGRVVREDPDDPRPYSYLVQDYVRHNDLDSAAWAYENLVRISPEDFRSWLELGRLRAELGQNSKAKRALQQSLEIDSTRNNIFSMATLGELYSREHNADSAVLLYNKALRIDPDNLLVHSLLVTHYTESDDPNDALPLLRHMTELEPDNAVTRRRLGLVYLELDSLAQSDSIFTALVAEGDRPWYNYFYLGQIKTTWKQYDLAAENFSAAADLNDSLSTLWLNLGFVYRQAQKRDKEIQAYHNGLSHITALAGRRDLFFALGVAFEQDNQVDSATWAFEQVLKIEPDNSQALNYLGYMLADRGLKLDYAHDLIKKANDLVPNNAAFLDSYGWVYFQMGDYKKAVKYLKQAVSLDSDATIFDHLGDAYNAIGHKDEAHQWWQRALELQPDNESLREKIDR
jgi:tetratricopeptide (TPR) repeat protein